MSRADDPRRWLRRGEDTANWSVPSSLVSSDGAVSNARRVFVGPACRLSYQTVRVPLLPGGVPCPRARSVVSHPRHGRVGCLLPTRFDRRYRSGSTPDEATPKNPWIRRNQQTQNERMNDATHQYRPNNIRKTQANHD